MTNLHPLLIPNFDLPKSTIRSNILSSYGVMKRILNDTMIGISNSFTPSRYLDVGCGSGASSLYLVDIFVQ